MTDNSGPAYPSPSGTRSAQPGMTLRQWYAGKALSGLCLKGDGSYSEGPCNHTLVTRSVVIADQMIAELDKT